MSGIEEVFPKNLDVFSADGVLLAINGYDYETIGTATVLDKNTTHLSFLIPPDEVNWTQLSDTVFSIKARYMKKDGSALPAVSEKKTIKKIYLF